MKKLLIHYRVLPAFLSLHISLLKSVFSELDVLQPAGIKYKVYQVEADEFVTLASFENPADDELFSALPAVVAFRKDMRSRITTPVTLKQFREIGDYEPTFAPLKSFEHD